MQCEAGSLVQRVADLSFALAKRFRIGLDEVTCEEFRTLQILEYEREKWQAEKSPNR
jgi:hypothetical protein